MMLKTIYILIIILFFYSCNEQKKNNSSNSEITPLKETILETNELNIKNTSNDILVEWTKYYGLLDSTFSLDNFTFEYSKTLMFYEGNVFGIYDEEYNNIYSDFIVYSPNRNKYIDFDSYQWSLDKNLTVLFSPDQEVNLVDINDKTVTRIGFYGSLNWVENGFWDNDTTIILLENSSENILRISVIDVPKRNLKVFKYKDSLNVKSEYSEDRLKRKGVKILTQYSN